MLGSQTWFLALACPTIAVGGFIASRKRLAYQWREELMDPENTAYPTIADAEMAFFRRVAPGSSVEQVEENPRDQRNAPPDAFGVALEKSENIGLRVRSGVLSPAEQYVYLNQVRLWATEVGNAVDPRKVAVFERRVLNELEAARERRSERGEGEHAPSLLASISRGLFGRRAARQHEEDLIAAMEPGFYAKLRYISDHAEDIQLMKAPWGSGDRMKREKLPAALRHLVQQTEEAHEKLGRLRHVYIEYSPTGKFFREPRTPKSYDGHDYVIIPLRRDGAGSVITFAPALRSKFSVLTEVMSNSWTSRDIDAYLPAGSMLRTTGSARYDWGWGVRPGPVWFGSRLNSVGDSRNAGGVHLLEASATQNGSGGGGWKSWMGWRGSSTRTDSEDSRGGSRTTAITSHPATSGRQNTSPTSSSATVPFSSVEESGTDGPAASRRAHAPPDAALPLRDAALVVLHFEGPRSENKKRSLLFQPEGLIFGKPPSVESFDRWVDDRPTREDVQEEGVIRFMLKRYFEMLTVS